MKISTHISVVLLGLFGSVAYAQPVTTGWYMAPTAGVVINDSNRAKDTGGAVGLVVGKVWNNKWNVEFGGQYLLLDGKHDKQANIGADALYFFNRNVDFAPYAIVGLAYAREGYSDTDNNDNLLVKGGVGFTKQLTKTIDFRTDVRYQWHNNTASANSLGDWVITVGLNIPLGK